MLIDANTVCPGGTGKRIKHCCPGRAADLDAIARLINGRQFRAALQRIEKLEAKYPDRACLLVMKMDVLGDLQRYDEVEQLIEQFAEKHPDNPLACSMAAMRKAQAGQLDEALRLVVHAWECSGEQVDQQVLAFLGDLMELCYETGQTIVALSISDTWGELFAEERHQQTARRVWFAANQSALMKLAVRLKAHRGEEPWAEAHQEAYRDAEKGYWLRAKSKLEQLAEQYPDAPAVWWNLAVLRGRLFDLEGARTAWEKYATLDVPLEDAVEAQGIGYVMSECAFADPLSYYELRYRVSDVARLVNLLSSSDRTVPLPRLLAPTAIAELVDLPVEDRRKLSPIACFHVYDRPAREPQSHAQIDSIPRAITTLCIYQLGDAEHATLAACQVAPDELDIVTALVEGLVGSEVQRDGEPKQTEEVSRSLALLAEHRTWSPWSYRLADAAALVEQWLEKACLETWPGIPLGILDELTPEVAAKDPKYRIRLLAAILVLEQYWEVQGHQAEFDFNRLRSKLGLPVLEPIEFVPAGEESITQFPATRLHRIDFQPMETLDRMRLLNYARRWGSRRAVLRFARAVLEHSAELTDEVYLSCLRLLVEFTSKPEEAFQAIERARQRCNRLAQSHASWHGVEARWRHRVGQHRKVQQIIAHVIENHFEESKAVESILTWAYASGYIDAQGELLPLEREPEQEEPTLLAVPGPDGVEPGKLWLPEDQQTQSGQRRLWVPGDE